MYKIFDILFANQIQQHVKKIIYLTAKLGWLQSKRKNGSTYIIK